MQSRRLPLTTPPRFASTTDRRKNDATRAFLSRVGFRVIARAESGENATTSGGERNDGGSSSANGASSEGGPAASASVSVTSSAGETPQTTQGQTFPPPLAIERRKEDATAIAPLATPTDGANGANGANGVLSVNPSTVTQTTPPATTKPVLSEEELLPPSKREPRGKEVKEIEQRGDSEKDGNVGGKDVGGSDKDGNEPSTRAGEKKAGTKASAGTATKTKTGGDKVAGDKKLATPRSPPPPSGGSIKSAAGASTDFDPNAAQLADGGGDGDDDDTRSGGGGGGGGDDDEEEEEEEEDDDDEVVLPDPWYKLAIEETERELARMMQQLLNIWITRDPSKTTRLILFSVMGTGLFLASLLLYPENPLEFSDDGLFSSVFGRNPRWVVNRELGPVQPTLLSTTCACAVAFAKVRLGANMFKLSPFMHGVLGIPMGFMLVFRWNNAHERWWYGRTCLGNILFYCKNLGGTFCTWVGPEDPMLAARALGLIGALKETVADRLNGTVLNDGAMLSQLTTPLDPNDLEGLCLADNKVLYCLEQLRGCVQDAFKRGYVPPAIASTIHNEVAMIMDNYGSCEKVVNQPPPGCIITHLKSTLMVYVCSLPMILVHEVGVWGVVPVTTILSLALFGIEAAAEQIEQPFGNRPYDLPVRALMNSNSRDLEQTSSKVLGLTGFVNGVKMSFTPETVPAALAAPSAPPAKAPKTTVDSTPAKAVVPVATKEKEKEKEKEAPVASATTSAPSAKEDTSTSPTVATGATTSVTIPSIRKDNSVFLSSDRLEAASVNQKESPFAFHADDASTSTSTATAMPAQQDAVRAAPQSSPAREDGDVPSRVPTPPPTTPIRGKTALQAAMDAVASSRAATPAPVGVPSTLSALRTGQTESKKTPLPAWKSQTPIEIYDQVLDERPSSTVPDSPRYHTQRIKRRDSYGQQFFDMFQRQNNSSGEESGDGLKRTSSLQRSNSTNALQSPSFTRSNPEGERDIRDIPFTRNAFRSSPSRSDLAAEEDGGVPMRRVVPHRTASVTDMSALEEAIKRAREARKRSSGLNN